MIEVGAFFLKNWKLIAIGLVVIGLGSALAVTKLRLEHSQNQTAAETTKREAAEHDRDTYKQNAEIATQTANDNAAALAAYKIIADRNAHIAADALTQIEADRQHIKDLEKGVYNAPAKDDAPIAPVLAYALNGLRGRATTTSGGAGSGAEGAGTH